MRAPLSTALFAICLATTGPALAQATTGSPTGCAAGQITVTGEAELRARPDHARVSFGVRHRAESAAEAMSMVSQAQSGVIETLTAQGISLDDIQTSTLRVDPVTRYGDGKAPKVEGYEAQNMLSVTLRDVARIGEVMDALIGSGVNEIQDLSFGLEGDDAILDEARTKAIADARHKAAILAGAAEVELGPVRMILEGGSAAPAPMYRMEAMASASDASMPIAAGQIRIGAQVTMTWDLKQSGASACGAMQDPLDEPMPLPAPDAEATSPEN